MKLQTLWNDVGLPDASDIRIKVYSHEANEYILNRQVREFFDRSDFVTWRDLLNRDVAHIYAQCNDESDWVDELVIEIENTAE